MIDEKASKDNEGKNRVYCLDCSVSTEDEVVRYDPRSDHPVVHHNNGHIHNVIFEADIQLLLELGTSTRGQSARYELAEMYGVSAEKLDQVLANVGGDL